MAAITQAGGATAARERRRVVAAFAASIAVHGLLLGAARGWRVADVAAPRIFVVTMLERGGGDATPLAGAAGSVATTARVGTEVPSPAVPAAVAAPPPTAHAPKPSAVRARPPRRREAAVVAAAPRLATPAAAAPAPSHDAAAGAVADGPSGAAAATASTGAADDSGGGTADAGGRGEGRGSGRGDGIGAGAGDGLRAFCASCPTPEYPARARRQGWQGTVDVALAIGGDGAVVDARVRRSSGYPPLDEVALDVARRSRFTVPAAGGSLRGELRYRFVLDAAVARR